MVLGITPSTKFVYSLCFTFHVKHFCFLGQISLSRVSRETLTTKSCKNIVKHFK